MASMGKITVLLNPSQRQKYLDELLQLDGLAHIKENPVAAYCPISLTLTPDDLKPILQSRQAVLMNTILQPAGIVAYDPSTAPYSPDTNLVSLPNEVYAVDSGKILGARYFVGHNLIASTGQGVECEKAKTFNRVAVILMDKNIRVSRMQPHRTIYLQYDNFEQEASSFIPLFKLLTEYEPGMGFHDRLPVLLGFHKKSSEVVDLEELVYRRFPTLQYRYDGTLPILKLRTENPDLFYENRG